MTEAAVGYRPNVAIVAEKKGTILLVHKPRRNDDWQFPQGGVDDGEGEHETVKREFQEEVGSEAIEIIKKSKLNYQYDFPDGYVRYNDSGKEYKGQRQSFWLVRFTDQRNALEVNTEELDNYTWIKPEELGDYIKRPEYLERCQEVLREFKLL